MGPGYAQAPRGGALEGINCSFTRARILSDTSAVDSRRIQKQADEAPGARPRLTGPSPYLVELVDRQFAFLSTRDADRLLMSVERVLGMLQREPTLAAILADFDAEVREAIAEYHAHERAMMARLREAFLAERATFLALAERGVEGFDVAAVEAYPDTLVPVEHLDYPTNEEPKWDRAASRHRLSKLRFWVNAARERVDTTEARARLANLEDTIDALRVEHEEAFRAYRTLGVTLPGQARARLAWAAGCLNPGRTQKRDAEAQSLREREDLASMLHEPTKKRLLTNAPGSEIVVQVRRDAELLREELVLALGRTLARHGKLRHVAEKLRRFHGDALAKAFVSRAPKRAEEELAGRLAEAYFDDGELAASSLARLEPGAILTVARGLAKPSAASARALVDEVAKLGASAFAKHGTCIVALLVVVTKAPRIVLPREVRRGEVTYLVETLALGRAEGSAPLVVDVEGAA